MKLHVLPDENFTCRSCTSCCRSWFVELMPGEEQQILSLQWPPADPLHAAHPILKHAGKTYLTRRPDGACLFLNESNGLCRIHEHFGPEAKPLGCRVFPYQIAPTFKDEATIIARYDCPTVRQNLGSPHSDELPTLRRLSADLGISKGFDEATSCHLTRDQIHAICDFLSTLMPAFPTNPQRALFLSSLADLLAQTDPNDLDRQSLAQIFPRLKTLVENAASSPSRPPNFLARMAFRTLLGLYLRRDEDVLNRRASRLARVLALTKIVLGVGSFHSLALSHPPGSLRKAHLFKPSPSTSDPATYALFWRMIRNRLDSFQFMGPANNNRNVLTGLRSLALLYPLVTAAAKYHAATRSSPTLDPQDIDFAVTSIEHSFGRLPILNQPLTRSLEKLLTQPTTFQRLINTI